MNFVHGGRKTREYKSWSAMRDRCLCPTNRQYAAYGGRGITVDPSWDSFEVFLADMGPRPVGFSLDRINNAEGYSKQNCRWASPKTQANNRREAKQRGLLSNNKTGVKGVSWSSAKQKYQVYLDKPHRKHLGYCNTLQEAQLLLEREA